MYGETKQRTQKHDRLLEINARLLAGEIVHIPDLAVKFGVDFRSIKRDIASLRIFYSNQMINGNSSGEIKYDRSKKGYLMVNSANPFLTSPELFAVLKIILESRSLSKEEVQQIISKLIDNCLPAPEQKKMTEQVRNEIFHYAEPHHHKKLLGAIWELGEAVYYHKIVLLNYQKANGEQTKASVKPVGIMVSEYYFYLIAILAIKIKNIPVTPPFTALIALKNTR